MRLPAARQHNGQSRSPTARPENGDFFQTFRIDYHGGERYPHLEPISGRPDMLTVIAKAKVPTVPLSTTY